MRFKSTPLNDGKWLGTVLCYFIDQISCRLGGHPSVVPFLDNGFLVLTPYTAPGIHYSRVGCFHDYEEMSLFRDALRPDDVFIDVGANAGSFSVIAIIKGCGDVVAFEPSSKTNWIANLNFLLNGSDPSRHLVMPVAVGRYTSKAVITNYLGGTDHLLVPTDSQRCRGDRGRTSIVDIRSLDSFQFNEKLGRSSFLALKIDVEGFDLDVLMGATLLLDAARSCLICVEANKDKAQIKDFLLKRGFDLVRYNPFTKTVIDSGDFTDNQNGLFVKGKTQLIDRLSAD